MLVLGFRDSVFQGQWGCIIRRCIREDDVLKTVPDLFQLGEDSLAWGGGEYMF